MKKLKTILAATLFPMIVLAENDARLLRFPTTNGNEVVFSYAGDLFSAPISGGEAHRLTSHIGYEMFARFSPDGKTIAFSGQYDGNTEVYTIPSEGGEPLRLTYTATLERDDIGDRMGPNNVVMGWTPDSKEIVYRSRKQTEGFVGRLYNVSKEGGLSEPIPLPEGGFCSYNSDKTKLAYNRVFREFRTWKYYQGGMADDIWIYDFKTKKTTNISNNKAQDIIPMYIGNKVYYLSDRDRVMNLFEYDTTNGETKKVTTFTEYDVKFPSSHGDLIVFENGGYLYKFDTKSGKNEKISININSDNIYARDEIKDASNKIGDISMSPGAERLIVTARGEIFNVPVKSGVTKNLSRTSANHERGAQWAPNGEFIAYISDKTGETEVYTQNMTSGEPTQLTKNSDTYIFGFDISPDSKHIITIDKKNRLKLIDVSTKASKEIYSSRSSFIGAAYFSPDSKWLTYTRTQDNDYSVVYVYNIATAKEYAITDKWYDSNEPTFSEDGKYLFFNSSRDFNPTYSQTEWNHSYNNMNGLYMVTLSKDTPSPFIVKDDTVGEAKDVESTEKKDVEISIDFEGIADRTMRIPIGTGYFRYIYSNNDKVYYSNGNSVKVYDLKELKEEVASDGYLVDVSADGKKALIRKGSDYYVANLGSKISLDKAVDMSNMKASVNYAEEWSQLFNEAWRYMRDGFYVENMHGVDWNKMKQKYEVLVPYVKHRLDLNYVIGEMIGELNCGHAYINPGETPRAERTPMGLLGAEISRDKSGYFRIDKVIEGASWNKALRSPFTEKGIDVKEGEYIIAIDGVDASTVNDLYKLLIGKADIPTEVTVNTTPSKTGARRVVILPIESEWELYHYNWVQNNIKKVEAATNGKVGYIYIPDMGPEGLNEFSRHFYPQLDKEGLIIDDRANGGGNVSPMILERLSREAYRVTMRRNSDKVSTVPDATHVGPKVCLINKYSASDGDLFPWGFRELGLGKLIGTRTWGGIVGISSSIRFIDGTDMRVPFFTSFSRKTGEWIIENHGVDPDILIDNDPAEEWAGKDSQLDRAIEEIMKELPSRQPLPKIPAPRDFSK